MPSDNEHIRKLRAGIRETREFPINTSPASRHLELMADYLATGSEYAMFQEEPKHCAVTMYAVLLGYYEAKARLLELESQSPMPGDDDRGAK